MLIKPDIPLGNPDAEKQSGKDLSDRDAIQIIEEYLKDIDYPSKSEKQFILCSVGLIATGKTTVLKALSEKIGLVRVRTDDLRWILEKRGYNVRRTAEIAYNIVMKLLKAGYSVAIDADSVAKNTQASLKNIGEEQGIPVIWIRTSVSEEIILDRLNINNTDREYKGPEAVSRYYERKKLHEGLDIPFIYEFDTSKIEKLEPQVLAAVKKIQEFLISWNTK